MLKHTMTKCMSEILQRITDLENELMAAEGKMGGILGLRDGYV